MCAYIAVLAVAGSLGAAAATRLSAPPMALLPWWSVALMFFATSSLVVHIHLRRDAHTVTLAEAPLALSLVLASPWALLLGSTLGTAAALLVVRRQPLRKFAFNMGSQLCIISAALGLLAFLESNGGDRLGAGDLLAVALTVLIVSGLGGTGLVALVMAASGERPARGRTLAVLRVTLSASLANTVMGVGAAHVVAHDAVAGITLAVPCLALVLAYRQYLREYVERTRLAHLYDAVRAFSGAGDVDAVVRSVLVRAREMLRGEQAELVLLPVDSHGRVVRVRIGPDQTLVSVEATVGALPQAVRDGRPHVLAAGSRDAAVAGSLRALNVRDAVIAPLRGEAGSLGCLLVADRAGDVATFSAGDLTLLETFASPAATWLSHARIASEMIELAYHDPLTGLANRAQLTRRLDAATLATAEGRSQARAAVVYLDLDDFKSVNDGLGHAAGDRLLVEVGERLRRCLRPADLAARLGGDEFAVLVEDVVSVAEAVAVARRVLAALRHPMHIDGTDLTVDASVGVVVTDPRDPAEASILLRHADVAMYRARARGKGRIEVFEPSMQALAMQRHRLKVDLEGALRDGDLTVVYQPVVELRGAHTVVGVEALVRWPHRTRGMVSPVDFIPLAEETGLIHQLGAMVLRRSLEQAASWQRIAPGLTMSVNVSGRQLRDPDFPALVNRALGETGLAPALLQLEVTETVMVADDEELLRALRSLRSLGLKLAIDDFGTGYSSLASLRNLPVDTLKVAKPFVDDLGLGPKQDAFAAAIVGLGHTLGLSTIAEGIETLAQADQLEGLGCHMAQGFLFARPMSAEAVTSLLAGVAVG